jgi:hypothetical protein
MSSLNDAQSTKASRSLAVFSQCGGIFSSFSCHYLVVFPFPISHLCAMDAASAAAAIVGLVFNCATAIKSCNDLRGKFRNADRTLRSMATEASTLRSALLQLQHLMMLDPAALSRWDMESMLPQTFETAIEGFRVMLAVLIGHLDGLTKKRKAAGSPLTRRAKGKMMWNEAEMQDVLVQIRAQQHSLQFLLTILQM